MIGTSTGPASFDGSGNALYNNRRTTSSSDRTLINAFRTICNMADRINLTKTITDRANKLFKTVHDGRNQKGRANDAIAAACMYIACRQEGVPRTFKEIVAVSTVSKKEIGRCFKLILKAQDIVPGRSPISVAAASIYMASHVCRFQKQNSILYFTFSLHTSGLKRHVADVTIRQSYKLMLPRATELFPSDFKFTTPIENLPQN